jgi:alanyl-tRNA synthetase
MLMSDGVSVSNEGRGYVLRRLLRRVVRALRLLGVDSPALGDLFNASKNAMVEAYPELEENFPRVHRAAIAEEAGFLRTLASGTEVLDAALETSGPVLSGEIAFQLHDTYGFPIDLTVEIAEEAGKSVDRDKFNELMQEQRSRAKEDAKSKKVGSAGLQVYSEFRALGQTQFLGYESLETQGKILGLVRDGESVGSLMEGQLGEVFIDQTSLYAESGGQAADAGRIIGDGFELEVLDVQKPVKGLFSHRVRVTRGEVKVDQQAQTLVDADWRLGACQAHSATHVVHAALRQVLGPEALQSGSSNKPGYMRLDFNWSEALSDVAKSEIEEVSNLAIRADLAVSAQFMTLPQAKDWGAIALFGETYDEEVRVVQVGGPWSRELCGGTHVSRSSQIGLVSLTSESSVGAGSRRIEALVGIDALSALHQERDLIRRLSQSLKSPADELENKIADSVEELRKTQRELAALQNQLALAQLPALAASAKSVAGLNVVATVVSGISPDGLRELATKLLQQLGDNAVVVLGLESDGRAVVMAGVAKVAQAKANAGALVKTASEVLGGGGGGRPDFAQGGGPQAKNLQAAIDKAVSSL